eukprot:3307999-Amphidinium_carterae.1
MSRFPTAFGSELLVGQDQEPNSAFVIVCVEFQGGWGSQCRCGRSGRDFSSPQLSTGLSHLQ